MEHHEELGERTRLVFTILTLLFAAIMVMPSLVPVVRKRAWIPVVATLVFLGAYGAGALLLINTGHEGGRLVHEYGVRALLPAEDTPASAPAGVHDDDDDDD